MPLQMAHPKSQVAEPPSRTVLSNCPQCDAEPVVLRVIEGKADPNT